MNLEYYTGIEFNARSGEYKSEPSSSISQALEMARIGDLQEYHKVTVYVKLEDKSIGIPYSSLKHLKNVEEVESELVKIVKQRNNNSNC